MIIGFNKQFPDKITAGTKKHTIREDVHNRWRAGMVMHMATGVRTKNYNCFKQDTCTGTQRIEIEEMITCGSECYVWKKKGIEKIFRVKVDGIVLSWRKIVILAHYDGFDSADEFFTWFNTNFTGKIIHWTGLRY